ncbi:hypothetical protein GXM_04608 [Nostoc sphaeroides CCNUC1]|uniref:Uncharacterized protein n=1 Tax=Nostoc sphaeroides CCNUC1 TaxID=2653204 RepID=A0A5P8W326_9NOSO|nr:hypothetical protein GXM_04608 [Nostoc sphaeroides CCNUC1]
MLQKRRLFKIDWLRIYQILKNNSNVGWVEERNPTFSKICCVTLKSLVST